MKTFRLMPLLMPLSTPINSRWAIPLKFNYKTEQHFLKYIYFCKSNSARRRILSYFCIALFYSEWYFLDNYFKPFRCMEDGMRKVNKWLYSRLSQTNTCICLVIWSNFENFLFAFFTSFLLAGNGFINNILFIASCFTQDWTWKDIFRNT